MRRLGAPGRLSVPSSFAVRRVSSSTDLQRLLSRGFNEAPSPGGAVALLQGLNVVAPAAGPVVPGNRPLVLYGAGNLGKLARSHLDVVGQAIAFVVDANAATYQNDPDWKGLAVRRPEEVSPAVRRDALLAVSIANSAFVPLRDHLADMGWEAIVPFYDLAESYRDLHPLSNGWFAQPLSASELDAGTEVLSRWADDASRAHHLRFAAWRLAREEWDFADAAVVPGNRFFIPEIVSVLARQERFLDLGAHHGTVTARLLQECGGAIARAWLVEPDALNRAVLQAWGDGLDAGMRTRLDIADLVVGVRSETVRFHSGLGYASQIAVTGQDERTCTTLDAMNIDPTFIKLHLEGAELDALKGALGTIRHYRPLVVATVYHNDDGLVRTPLWLMRNLEDYRFLMRTHSWCGTGAVIYALPKERMKP